jgi:hypothetical protein
MGDGSTEKRQRFFIHSSPLPSPISELPSTV